MPGTRIAIVVAEFNSEITMEMLRIAREKAKELGATVVAEARAPGTYDIPLLAKTLALRPDVEAVVCLGAVITGETGHDELILNATARSLQQISLETMKPVTLGITGPRMTEEQARARIDYAANAVAAAVKMRAEMRKAGSA